MTRSTGCHTNAFDTLPEIPFRRTRSTAQHSNAFQFVWNAFQMRQDGFYSLSTKFAANAARTTTVSVQGRVPDDDKYRPWNAPYGASNAFAVKSVRHMHAFVFIYLFCKN